jgi:DNA-binding NtrC family response regulator
VVRVNLPPLRERSSDVPLLVGYFINKFRLKQPTGPSQIADEALTAIQRHSWPGNVRELENCVQRAMVLASGNTITLANLPEEIAQGYRTNNSGEIIPNTVGPSSYPSAPTATSEGRPSSISSGTEPGRNELLPAAERELIVRALAETSGNQVQAAKLLGITRATLRKRVDKFGIHKRMAID